MDGRYIFRNCVPEGNIDIANVAPGNVLDRSWSFRVNSPLDLQQSLDSGNFDPRNILRGHDGELFDGDGNFLAEVNTWHAQINVTNTDYQPAGQKLKVAIPQDYTITLTFTETIIKDARILYGVLASLQAGAADASLNFQGVLRGHNAV